MEPDLKPILIRAVERNDENEVKRLIDAGADVNETDDQGKTALFYAAQNNNEGIAVLLIGAGADVDAKANQDKTALFYAAAITSTEDACGILTALVEKGKACIDAPDIYGRTPLFYAITNSILSTRYLLDNEANAHAEDNCNVSILTYILEHCLMKPENPSNSLSEVLSLLAENGLEKQSIVQSMLNLVFCKVPVLLCSDEKETAIPGLRNISKEHLLNTLAVAIQYLDERSSKKKDLILQVEEKIRRGEIFEALELLCKLRANPNSTDCAGNTALHYTTTLPLMGVPRDSVMKICEFLRRKGAHFNKPSHQSQTPLLFCLSPNNWKETGACHKISGTKTLVDVCAFLLRNGSKLSETLKNKENVFHLLIKLFQQVLDLRDKVVRESVLQELIKLLEVFGEKGESQGKIGNDHDENGNSPLHLWPTLTLASPQDYTSNMCENYTFEKFLKLVLDSLLNCGANVNDRNHENETPLHLCNTWTAVKLLLDAGANPNDVDSSDRSPLLVAARRKTFLKHPERFYPDVTDDAKTFWKNALKERLDPWKADKQDKSVLSLLIEFECFVLARDLVDVAFSEKHTTRDAKMSLLVAVCKDESRQTRWKSILVKTMLGSRKKFPFPIDESLRWSCRNIKEFGTFDEEGDSGAMKSNDASGRTSEQDEKENTTQCGSVHCEIATLLLWSGADIKARDDHGVSSLDIAENCPALMELLTKTVDANSVSIVIPWASASKCYRKVLENVAKQQECDQSLDSYWYHKNAIKTGKFGEIFAGISVNDGREVAIKRIEKLRIEKLQRPRDRREVKNLTDLADCQQVVRYLWFDDKQDEFSYVVLELMEGNLEEYLTDTFDPNRSLALCQDVVMGMKYLHERNIIHRDLKPGNILYKVHPKLCLKIADFGLSRRIDSSGSNTVYSIDSATKCWIAPEVLSSSDDNYQHSKSSDVFSCGLVLHYILSVKRHPFSPAGFTKNLQVVNETEANIMNGVMEGWDDSLSPEATHLVKKMLASNEKDRPSAEEALEHPLFWSQKKKINFLKAVGNQKEFEKETSSLTPVEADLKKSLASLVAIGKCKWPWNDPGFSHMPAIYHGMTTSGKGRKIYDTSSAVELVRFIRNVYEHYREKTFVFGTVTIGQLLFEDFVFLGYFPDLVMEVYKAVTTHGWDKTRDDVNFVMNTE